MEDALIVIGLMTCAQLLGWLLGFWAKCMQDEKESKLFPKILKEIQVALLFLSAPLTAIVVYVISRHSRN